jgi:hypothetical protein
VAHIARERYPTSLLLLWHAIKNTNTKHPEKNRDEIIFDESKLESPKCMNNEIRTEKSGGDPTQGWGSSHPKVIPFPS